MPDVIISPTVVLGIVLFIVIFFVVRLWLLQDDHDRRDERDRRHASENLVFPFYDGEGSWVMVERRKRPDRRQVHTFITRQDFHRAE